jgi:hypothetical protein
MIWDAVFGSLKRDIQLTLCPKIASQAVTVYGNTSCMLRNLTAKLLKRHIGIQTWNQNKENPGHKAGVRAVFVLT